MQADLLKGKWMQLKSKLKQQRGTFMNHDLQENERSYDKIIGMVQERYGRDCASLVRERYGENKDELMKWADQWQQRAQPEAAMDMTRRGEIIKKIWIAEYGHISHKQKTMKTHFLLMLSIALIVGATLTAVPATAVHISKEKTLVNDSWLTAKTKIALTADARVKGRQVNVETKKGIVSLRGMVDTPQAKTAAEEITRGIEGVASVRNELQVVAATKRKVVQDNDDAITKTVKRHIEQDRRLKNADIEVKTNGGVVSLTGQVTNLDTSANASMIAWRVPGVRSVKNDITIKMDRG